MLGCQAGVTVKVESHLDPRYKQMKNTRPFEGNVSEQISCGLSDQTRLSMLSWNARPKRGKVANSVVGSYHVILLQEAESHFQDITKKRAEQQFHINQGADQVILL